MGMQSTIQTAMAAAFDGALADAVRAFTYTGISSNVYESGSAGGAVATEDAAPIVSRGVFEEVENDADISPEVKRPIHSKLIVLQNEISASEFDEGGSISSSCCGSMAIIKVMADPAAATWIFYLRKDHV